MTRVEAEDGQPDPTLAALVAEAAEDEDTLGVILTGSRGADLADESSDYDLLWVLTDGAYEQRRAAGGTKIERRFDVGPPAEIVYTSPQVLRETAEEPGWWTPGIASGVLLLDKTGEVAERLQQVAHMPEERARADADDSYDAYLNGFVRSVRAWQRGDELGGRLHATESLIFLVRALFALEARWAPYHDRVASQLAKLGAHGWERGYLEWTLLELARTGDPALQAQLQARVERLMDSRGVLAHREWGEGLERAKRAARARAAPPRAG